MDPVTTSTWIFSDWVWGIFTDSHYGNRWGRWYEEARRWAWEPVHSQRDPFRLYAVPARIGERADLVRWTEPRRA